MSNIFVLQTALSFPLQMGHGSDPVGCPEGESGERVEPERKWYRGTRMLQTHILGVSGTQRKCGLYNESFIGNVSFQFLCRDQKQ